jgi:hypothetical protein
VADFLPYGIIFAYAFIGGLAVLFFARESRQSIEALQNERRAAGDAR